MPELKGWRFVLVVRVGLTPVCAKVRRGSRGHPLDFSTTRRVGASSPRVNRHGTVKPSGYRDPKVPTWGRGRGREEGEDPVIDSSRTGLGGGFPSSRFLRGTLDLTILCGTVDCFSETNRFELTSRTRRRIRTRRNTLGHNRLLG